MKNRHSELTERYLVLFKIDATNLYNRLQQRARDSIESFSLKRNRAVFKEVFENRYQKATIGDLSACPVEVIEVLNTFYEEVDNLYWYLKTTQDMPNTIEDELTRKLSKLSSHYQVLCLFVDAELSGKSVEELESFKKTSNIHDLEFSLEGERQDALKQDEFIQDLQEDITQEPVSE